MQLASAPLILFVGEDGQHLATHTGLPVEQIVDAYLDEEGALLLVTEHGPGEVAGLDLQWALDRLFEDARPVDDDSLAAALAVPSGSDTRIRMQIGTSNLPLRRLDFSQAPSALRFERNPAPRDGEKVSTRTVD
jgi:hypothetical protein